ncbi:hypothetical protein LO763_07880 [Glycomyces sp. A-F 0318]|uniref:hypothetical protein n=1 Tax=Glycomyces amatae TaxID=2881355 RepID=UPI001E2E58E2|nr:hypothetical protein [Glycomyces amatae]MCD0443546.1 hypothetical protein [Glycomyces amatae]
MSAPGLARRLLAVGFTAGRRAEAGRIRFASLAAAAAALSLALAAVAAIGLAQSARLDRAGAGVPVLADTEAPRSDTLLMSPAFDDLRDGRQFQVFYLEPLGPGAPLPPGLDRWPEPGQVYLSPRLAEKGADEGIAERYGEFAGLIDPDSLADPGEQLAYVRSDTALDAERASAMHVTGFATGGDPAHARGVHWLAVEHDFSVGGLVAIALAMLLLPAVLLTVVAVRTGAELRDRREHLVTVLGGGRRSRFLISLGESALPAATGAALAAVAIGAASLTEFHVPYTGFVIAHGDLLSGWWLLAACPAAAGAAVLLASALLGARATGRRSTRPRPAWRPRVLLAWAALCPVFLFVGAVVPRFFAHTPGYPLSNLVGVVGVVVTLPAAVAVATAWCARRIERFGRRRGRPALLVVGRRIAAHPRAVARQITGVATGAVLLCLTLAYQGAFSQQAVEAERYLDRYGYRVAQVGANGTATEAQTADFLDALSGKVDVVSVEAPIGPEAASVEIAGECRDLEALGLPCPAPGAATELSGAVADDRLAHWLDESWYGDATVTVANASPSAVFAAADQETMLLVFDPGGGDVPVAEVKSAGKAFTMGVIVSAPGGRSLSAGVPLRDQSRWAGLFGAAGLVLLAGVAAVGGAGEFIRHSRALSPLAAVTGGFAVFRGMAGLAVWTPLLVAAVGGFAVGVWVTRPMTAMSLNLVTPELVLVCGGLVLVVGALMWWWAAAAMVAEASRWRPGRGD